MHSDEKAPHGQPDRMHVNLDDAPEVDAMVRSLCVTPRVLRDAAVSTGTDIAALEARFHSE